MILFINKIRDIIYFNKSKVPRKRDFLGGRSHDIYNISFIKK